MKRAAIAALYLLTTLVTPLRADADVVTEWNSAALSAIRTSRTSPPAASRALAMLHVSVYDAVTGITRRHEPYLVQSTVPASASKEAAVSAAAFRVLVALFPQQSSQFTSLHQNILGIIPDGPQKQSGLAWGGLVADEILGARANDGADASAAAPVGAGPGAWEPTPPAFAPYLLAHWGSVKPFVMNTGADFRPDGPPALDSPQWAAEFK